MRTMRTMRHDLCEMHSACAFVCGLVCCCTCACVEASGLA